MKFFIALLAAGTLGTFLIIQNSVSVETRVASGERTLKYDEINNRVLNQIKSAIAAEKNQAPEVVTSNSVSVEGKAAFVQNMETVFAYLKSNQVLYRYELNNSLKVYLNKMDSIQKDEVDGFNTRLNESLEFHKNTISRLSFTPAIKAEAVSLVDKLKSPLSLKSVVSSRTEDKKNTNFLAKLEASVQDLTTSKEVHLHNPEVVTPKGPVAPIVALWSLLCVATFMFLRKKTVVTVETEELINPTFKRIMSDLDYPLVMVDQGLNVIWQNKKSESSQLEMATLQEIFNADSSEEAEIKVEGKYYAVTISELAYKSGKKNFLAQLKPKMASNKHLEHLIDYRDVTSFIETHNSTASFGDVNQSVAQLSVKLGYLFKVSGKFLDLNFKKDISDCFIENDRLEGMMKEFIMGCHHIIKDESEVPGIYLRTNESGNKFSVSCFLMNFRTDALESHPMTRDFLRRFSVLEAKYSICSPAIEFRFKETSEIKGLDITLNFENRSELESIINNMSADA
ncbi:MAG: hypothetical protein H0V66_00055 [Bdellovibrionales bacterium]|nr:hypothetical protein [Bdellovibrionales bacterium]